MTTFWDKAQRGIERGIGMHSHKGVMAVPRWQYEFYKAVTLLKQAGSRRDSTRVTPMIRIERMAIVWERERGQED